MATAGRAPGPRKPDGDRDQQTYADNRGGIASFPGGSGSMEAYCFGEFHLDRGRRLLQRAGQPVALNPKAFDLLVLLVESGGRVLLKNDLMRALWPDSYVEESSLTRTVSRLRKALGGDGDRYIVTVPWRGYRFCAAVATQQAGGDDAGALPAINAAPVTLRVAQPAAVYALRPSRRRDAAIVVAVTVAAVLAYCSFTPPRPPRVLRFLPAAALDGSGAWQRLVTDGARVFYLQRAGNEWKQMQTSVSGGEARELPVPFRNTLIFDFSRPRSEFLIGNFDAPGLHLPLWIWPVQGGKPRRVGSVVADSAAWTPGGEIGYVTGHEIRLVRPDGSGDRLLVRAEGAPSFLRWSPDGARMTFTVTASATAAMSLWEAAGDGSNPHPRKVPTGDQDQVFDGTWSDDGLYFFYLVRRAGVLSAWAQRETPSLFHWGARDPVQLTSDGDSVADILPIGRGNRTFMLAGSARSETVRYFPSLRHTLPLLAGLPGMVEFSPDGRSVVLQRMPDWTLWRMSSDGSQRVQLVSEPMRAAQPKWSPDGTLVAFEGRLPGHLRRAYVVSAGGGAPQEIAPQLAGSQSLPSWSPDGQSLVLAMNVDEPERAAQPRGIFVVDRRTRAATLVPNSSGMTDPSWSPDGKFLIAKTLDEHAILRYDAASRRWIRIATGLQLTRPTWSADSKWLYVQDILQPGEPVYRLRTGSFARSKAFSFESLLDHKTQWCVFLGLSPDGVPLVELHQSGMQLYPVDLDLP